MCPPLLLLQRRRLCAALPGQGRPPLGPSRTVSWRFQGAVSFPTERRTTTAERFTSSPGLHTRPLSAEADRQEQ
eukprot:6657346-Pyramimonas_sp.AAC.1